MLLHKKKLYLFLLIFLSLSIIFSLLFPQRWLIKLISHVICPNAVYFKVTDEPIVALTIDDSPDVNTTKQILTVLAKYKKIVATFFPISNQVTEHQTLLLKS